MQNPPTVNLIERLPNTAAAKELALRIDNVNSAGQGYDIFVLCGQSNAEGASTIRDVRYDAPHSNVFCFAPGTTNATYQWGQVILLGQEKLPNIEGNVYSDSQNGITFATNFARQYAIDNPGKRVLIFCGALGNTGFSTNHWNKGNILYNAVVNGLNQFIANNLGSTVKAFLWHQGERDHDNSVLPEVYQANLFNLITNFRNDINTASGAVFIAGELSRDWAPGSARKGEYHRIFNRLFLYFDKAGSVSSENVSTIPGDSIHFSTPGLRTLGNRYYEAYLLAKERTLQSPAAPTNIVFTALAAGAHIASWAPVFNALYYKLRILQQNTVIKTWLINTNNAAIGNIAENTELEISSVNPTGENKIIQIIPFVAGTVSLPNPLINLEVATSNPALNTGTSGASAVGITGAIPVINDSEKGLCALLVAANTEGLRAGNQPTNNSYTRALWINPKAWDSQAGLICIPNGDAPGIHALTIFPHNGGIALNTSAGEKIALLNFTPQLNRWVHIAATYLEATKQFNLYINGVRRLQQTLTGTYAPNSTNDLMFIGAINFGFGVFQGLIKHVRVYTTALTDAQIAQLCYQTI